MIKTSPKEWSLIKDAIGSDKTCFDFNRIIPIPENVHPSDWCWGGWGTKWNARDSKVVDEKQTFEFLTAWDIPHPVLLRLSKMFSSSSFYCYYAGDGGEVGCGLIVFKDGETVTDLSIYDMSCFEKFSDWVWNGEME